MRSGLRTLLIVSGLAVLVFGYFCLNYTRAGNIEQHTAFAIRHGLPQPSRTIFYGGVFAVAAGAGAIGYALGRSAANIQ
jgi:hypothetical protein